MRIDNTAQATYPSAIGKLSEFRYLTTSQECTFLEEMAIMDFSQTKDIENKLFNKFKIDGIDDTYELYLKNKYLYMFTEGAINYIEALKGMERVKEELGENEKKVVHGVFADEFAKNGYIPIVSLGAGASDKEIIVLNKLRTIGAHFVVDYFPLDVSTYLLQLGVLKFFEKFPTTDSIKIYPVVADFWDTARYCIEKGTNLFDSPQYRKTPETTPRRLFLFLGGTFGNYYEKDLLDQIIQIMNYGDKILIGIDIWSGDVEEEKKRIFKAYNTLGNLQWLLQPLCHIPWYAGYLSRFRYLKFEQDSSILFKEEPEKKYISAVPNTICYAPIIELPAISMRDTTDNSIHSKLRRIRLASTTKYLIDSLQEWLKEYRFNNSMFYINRIHKTDKSAVLELTKKEINQKGKRKAGKKPEAVENF